MSARRPRTSNRRYAKGKERSLDRDDEGIEKNKQRKRKLSDLLGPPWSEDDLKHFYQSYRRHGKDWKKVAATLPNRTVEMVEVLYNMNKAYLSLPEGAASAAGLIAMMTDHYNILNVFSSQEDSRSLEDENSKEIGVSIPSHQVPARMRDTSVSQQGTRNAGSVPQVSGLSSYGGPSPVKKPRTVSAVNPPRAVGKRTPRITPRVPAIHPQDKPKCGKFPLSEAMEDVEQDSFGESDEVKVALTLASASQRAASPQISRTPACRSDRSRSIPVQNGHASFKTSCHGSGSSGTRHTGSNMDDGGTEESRDTENGVVTKASTSIAVEPKKRSSPAGEAKSKYKKNHRPQTKKGKLSGFDCARSDELKEECSCTEEGTLKGDDAKGVNVSFKSDQAPRKKRPPSQRTKKRNRQLFSGGIYERSGLDALATLAADLSSLNGLNPSTRLDGEEPSMNILDLRKGSTSETLFQLPSEDLVLKVGPPHGLPEEARNPTMKDFLEGRQEETHSIQDVGSNFESDNQKGKPLAELRRKKKRSLLEKKDQFSDGNSIEHEEKVDTKASNKHSDDRIVGNKSKRSVSGQSLTKCMGRPIKQEQDQDLDCQDVVVGECEVAVGPALDKTACPAKQRNRQKSKSSALSVTCSQCIHTSLTEESHCNKVKITHCLSSEKVRRWCLYEWFYSAIDLPWFRKNDFVGYLNHAGLGHVPRLTRAEWSVIRGSLGKARRLSKRFLQQERKDLESYRDSVRDHYKKVRLGRDGLPTDLPRPLSVGQRVIARHPKTKEVYNGSILTVDEDKCRVQFDRPEMGVELVMDIDCMPINSFENLSDTLFRKNILADNGNRAMEDSKHGIKAWMPTNTCLASRASSNDKLDRPAANISICNSSSSSLLNTLCKQAQAANTVDSVLQVKAAANEAVAAAQQSMLNQPCSLAQVQAKEADIRALADLTRALDKKEAILVELRNMNDDADTNQRDGDAVRSLDMFRKQYATLIVQLKEVNQQVCGALMQLRQRNKYQENCQPPWQRSAVPVVTQTHQGNMEGNAFSLDQFPLAKEVTIHAKHHARLMVNTAVETILSIKDGEDALFKIGAALNQLPKASMSIPQPDVNVKVESSSGGSSGLGGPVNWSNTNHAAGATDPNDGKDSMFLADLMSTCVATLLMVQAFTERQFPPADIAMAFDSILANMRPTSSHNYQLYTEIKHYASLLKNQIIALIPTQPIPVDCPSLPR
ncbi:hypothetical protein KP509_20G005600 [Ceratopteris richardii]|uniref:Uncharacterized protein n=1 Tax=Ceratopteris richardii TaxID=49495 RepID=A0A8T2SER6_CERRI|nr:hypothetical protein KP509_20G005600 [Ceratopteris richardii]